MKTYKIEIYFAEGKNVMTRITKVNGKEAPLPKKLWKWICEDYLEELFSKDR